MAKKGITFMFSTAKEDFSCHTRQKRIYSSSLRDNIRLFLEKNRAKMSLFLGTEKFSVVLQLCL